MDTQHETANSEKGDWRRRWKEQGAVRTLTAVIVLIFVFWCGFQFGEIKAMLGARFQGASFGGARMMQGVRGGTFFYHTTVSPPSGTVTNVTAPAASAAAR